MDEHQLTRLWKSRKTILKYLVLRGYDVQDDMTYEMFKGWTENNGISSMEKPMILTYHMPNDENDRIKVYWPVENKLGGPGQRVINNDMEASGVTKAIVVVEDGNTTPQAKEMIRLLRTSQIYIDVFTIPNTQVDVSKHSLVPKHILCSNKEKKRVLEFYAVKPDQLPGIKQTDVQVKILGARKGQMIKIIRESDIYEGYYVIEYRIVN